MKNKLLGALRILLALAIVVSNSKYAYSQILKIDFADSSNLAYATGTVIAILLVLNFVLYMALNGIRQINARLIKYKAMYIIGLIFMVLVLVTFIAACSSVTDFWTFNVILVELFFILTCYYLIADFPLLFVRGKGDRLSVD